MTPDDRLAWLLDRQTGIGASDAPNLVGVGFGDAAHVYREKTTPPAAHVPAEGPLARGIALEAVVAERYADEMGVRLVPPRVPIYRHPARAWQFASPDRLRRHDGRPVQIKTVAGFSDEWGPSGTDLVPDGYRVQVQQEMGVLGADRCDLAALDVITWELRVYKFAFDRPFFEWLTGVEEMFLLQHLMPRVPPGPEWEAQFRADALAKIVKPGERVELPAEVAALIDRRKELGAIRDEADEEYKRLGAEVEALMGTAEAATCGPWKLKRIAVAGGEYTATRRPYVRLDVRAAKKGKGAE